MPVFRQLGHDLVCYFYNPNIHPFQEHKRRKQAFIEYMELEKQDYLLNTAYPLEEWLLAVAAEPARRCRYCYQSRLRETARYAAEQGFAAFSTTLLISPYQDQQLICQIGGELAMEYGLVFDDRDLRPHFPASQARAVELGLYRQAYCGCIYSERDRYQKKKRDQSETNLLRGNR